VIAQILFAFDFSGHRLWAVQAAGFGVAALVLMVGRFITAANRRPAAPLPPARRLAQNNHRRLPDSSGPADSEITLRVEDAWK
jgi:hypothetical protein